MDNKNLFNEFLNQLFGEEFTCVLCDEERINNHYNFLCKKCYDEINFITFGCEKCGGQLNSFTRVCDNCKEKERNFDYVICVSNFDGSAKNLVYKLKYGKQEYIANTIALFMADKFKEVCNEHIDIVTCIPTTRKRFLERGFNQADLIAQKVTDYCNLKYFKNIILRIKDTSTQTHLSRQSRQENLQDAFIVVDNVDLKDKTVLVIDDVYTTGATLDSAAKVLKEKGACKVIGLVFCHA